MNYHEMLKARRQALGLTVATVADRTGVHTATVYAWEAGDHTPSPEHVCRWAAAVRLPLSKLVDGDFTTEAGIALWAADQTLKHHSRLNYRPCDTVTAAEARLLADAVVSRRWHS